MTTHTTTLLPVRASVGAAMTYHGSQKLVGAFGGPGLAGTEQMLGSMKIEPRRFWARALAWTETVSGVALLAGVFVRPAALGIAISQAVAVWKVHAPHGFEAAKGGYEYNLALIAAAIALFIEGGGELSAGEGLARMLRNRNWRSRLRAASHDVRGSMFGRPWPSRLLEAAL